MRVDNKYLYSFPRSHMLSCHLGVTMASLSELIWGILLSCDLFSQCSRIKSWKWTWI